MGTAVEIGKRYRFMWPSRSPSMRLVGTVIASKTSESMGQSVKAKWSDEYPPHDILITGTRVEEVPMDTPGAFQMKMRK